MGGLILLYAVLVFWLGQVRPIDGDEGFYAAAAGLVNEGRSPYQDFFYPQGPLLPYLYGWLVGAGGHHLKILRLGSSLLAVLAVVPWLLFLADRKRLPLPVAVTAALLLLLDPHLLSWNATIKTFAFCNLSVSWSLYFLWRGLRGRPWPWLAAVGLALGLCVSARTLYAPLALALWGGVLVVAIRRRTRAAWLGVAAFAAGGLLGLWPLLAAWFRNPDLFWFNNVVCHQIRYSDLRAQGLGDAFGPRLAAAAAVAGRVLFLKPFRLLVLVLALVGWRSLWTGRAVAEAGGDGRSERASWSSS